MSEQITDASIIGYNLRRLLNEKDCSQLDFAKAIGEKPTTVNMWVTGKVVPRFSKFGKMADFFGVRISDITERKDTSRDERLLAYFQKLSKLPDDRQKAVMDMIDLLGK